MEKAKKPISQLETGISKQKRQPSSKVNQPEMFDATLDYQPTTSLPPEKKPEPSNTNSFSPKGDFPIGTNVAYMPIDRLRAQVFLIHGLLFPHAYDSIEGPDSYHDLQRNFSSDLLFLKTPSIIAQDQVLLAVAIEPEELEAAQHLSPDSFLLSIPLPISRVLRIALPTPADDLQTQLNGWEIKDDVPVPRHLFVSIEQLGILPEPPSLIPSTQASTVSPELLASVARFDRALGALAFVRNADRYFTQTGSYADYCETFFVLASLFAGNQLQFPESRPPSPLLRALFSDSDTEGTATTDVIALIKRPEPVVKYEDTKPLARRLYDETGKLEAFKVAFDQLVKGDYISAVSSVLSQPHIPEEARVVLGLVKFGDRNSNDYRTIKQTLSDIWPDASSVEPLLVVLGAFYGYSRLDAREKQIYSVQSLFSPLLEATPPIKFFMETAFESILVEAVYQRSFFNRDVPPAIKHLYSSRTFSSHSSPRPNVSRQVFDDRSYSVGDLRVARFSLTQLGNLVRRLEEMAPAVIDEKSTLGQCLFCSCVCHADDFDFSVRQGRVVLLHFRIARTKLLSLISSGTITVSPDVLNAALTADSRSVPK